MEEGRKVDGEPENAGEPQARARAGRSSTSEGFSKTPSRYSPDSFTRVALALVLATPAVMVFFREVPATMLTLAVAMFGTASILSRRVAEARHSLLATASAPAALAALCLVAWAFISNLWSPAPLRGFSHSLHFGGALLLAAIGASIAATSSARFSAVALAIAIISASVVGAADLLTEGGLRGALALSTEKFRLNRAAVGIVLFLPLATALLLAQRRSLLLIVVWISALTMIAFSESQSARLGVICALLILPTALAFPTPARRLVGAAMVVVILGAPILSPLANDMLPQSVHDAIGYSSLTIRGDIWRETAAFVWQSPFLGWGMEASIVLPELSQAAGLTDRQRDLLSWGHPHNAPLQIWLELGLVGALLAAGALAFGFRALGRLPAHLLPAATTTAAIAFAIACVSHGAWQAWWWGLLGLVTIAFAAAASAPRDEA